MPTGIVNTPNTLHPGLIRQSVFFSLVPRSLLQDMAEEFRWEEWEKDTYIDPEVLTKKFCILLDGQLEMKRINPDTGREVTLSVLHPGDSFDVISLLDNKPHDVILESLTGLKLMSVPMETMRHWLWTFPELNQQFLPYLASKMREQEELTTNIALHDTATRLSRILLQYIDKLNAYKGDQDDAHKTLLIHGLSDEKLAHMVGTVRQVINKHLQHWKEQGMLDKKRNELIINDLEALRKEAGYLHSNLQN